MWLIFSLIFVVAVCAIICLIFIDNRTINYEQIKINTDTGRVSTQLPIKIVHLSDLHFPRVMVDTSALLERIAMEKVDAVAISGDLIMGSANVESCGVFDFILKLKTAANAPIFYVNGNHEIRNPNSKKLYNFLKNVGVIILENCCKQTEIKGRNLTFYGVFADTGCLDDRHKCEKPEDSLSILLAHRPENFDRYIADEETRPDIILTGHAHGGLIRLFGLSAFAPGQGFFPKLTSVLNQKNGSLLLVSRGIGCSTFPFRFNNLPHVLILEIN